MFEKLLKLPLDRFQKKLDSMPEVIDINKKYAYILYAVLSIFVIISCGIFFNYNKEPPKALYVDNKGIITQPRLFPSPGFNDVTISNWVTDVVIDTTNYDYVHYESQIYKSKEYFTLTSWDIFKLAQDNSELKLLISTRKLRMQSVLLESPIIVKKSINKDKWLVEAKALVILTGDTNEISKNIATLLITVEKVPTLLSPRGLAVSSYKIRLSPYGR